MYLARDIPAFVMYCVNGESGSSLLIESTDSMMIFTVVTTDFHNTLYSTVQYSTVQFSVMALSLPYMPNIYHVCGVLPTFWKIRTSRYFYIQFRCS